MTAEDNWKRACQWRAARILRFADRQSRNRAWIRFTELAERYGRNVGVSEGYEQLRLAVIAGEFERNGRCRVFYLHPGVVRSKMTRGMMANITATFPAPTIERQYLGCCWIPRDLAIAWCGARNVSVAGWLEGVSGQFDAKPRRGRQTYNDGPALVEMKRLCATGMSVRGAARQAAAIVASKGNSADAIVDRLRRKFHNGNLPHLPN